MKLEERAALGRQSTDLAAHVEPGRTAMLAALRYRDFRLFWIGHLVSNVGTWMQLFGMGWLVVLLAIEDGSPQLAPLYLGLTGLARALPGLGLGLFAGAVADRTDRRQLLLVTQVVAGILSALLGTLTLTGGISIWAVLCIGAASSAVFSFDAPTRQSMVPRLVPARDLMSAIGLNSAAFNGPQIIGPAIGGLLIGPIGIAGLFFANSLSYLAVVAALVFMKPIPPVGSGTPTGVTTQVREGLRYIRRDPVLLWTIVLAATTALVSRPYIFLMPAVATNILGVGATELSWLMTATGIGAFGGSLVVANLGGARRRGRLLLYACMASGVGLAIFALQRDLAASLAATFVGGLFMLSFTGLTNTILQTQSPDHLRGRVMSVMTMSFMGLMPLGQLILGTLGTFLGVDVVLFAGGVVTTAAAAYAFLRVGALRELVSTRRPHAHPHPVGSAAPAE